MAATGLPAHASELKGHVAFAWQVMDGFYEEDERIAGHAADCYHRIDTRQTSRHLVVRYHDRVIADTGRPRVLYESGFAPLCSYYTIGEARLAAWSYPDAYPEVGRISNLVSFEPEIVTVHLDGAQLHLEPGQDVIPHGPDRNLTVDEAVRPAHLRERAPAGP